MLRKLTYEERCAGLRAVIQYRRDPETNAINPDEVEEFLKDAYLGANIDHNYDYAIYFRSLDGIRHAVPGMFLRLYERPGQIRWAAAFPADRFTPRNCDVWVDEEDNA